MTEHLVIISQNPGDCDCNNQTSCPFHSFHTCESLIHNVREYQKQPTTSSGGNGD